MSARDQEKSAGFDIFKELFPVSGQAIIAITHDDDFARNNVRVIELAGREQKKQVNAQPDINHTQNDRSFC